MPASWPRYRARLLETFPEERAALGTVVDILREVADAGRRFQRGELAMQDMAEKAPAFLQWGLRPVTDLFAEHRLSDRAAAVPVAFTFGSTGLASPKSRILTTPSGV